MTKEEFIERANKKHNGKYDYSLLPNVVKYDDVIEIICNEKYPWGETHGKTRVKVGKHLSRGDGCTKCSGRYKRTKEDFIKEATFIHNGIYTYKNFVWGGTKKKGTIHCCKHNIDFSMTPEHHLNGQGCPKCRYEKISKSKTKPFSDFKREAMTVHNGKYGYIEGTYVNREINTKIICPIHGEFWQTPNNHLKGEGCDKCGREQRVKERTMSYNDFVKNAKLTHCINYVYDEKTYINASSIVDIFCPKHGWFKQLGTNHLYGQNCGKCSNQMSKAEEEIFNFIHNELGIKDLLQRDRTLIYPYEIDLYIPSKKIAIEYNGLLWHSSKFNDNDYHLLKKTEICKEKGLRLIHIYEDEWMFSNEKVKSRLSSILGLNKNKIYARNCVIKEINSSIAKIFLNKNHIQSNCNTKFNYGLFFNDELVSVMTFCHKRKNLGNTKVNNDEYELLRFCNKLNTNVFGGASKLLTYFINTFHPQTIITYADKRWSDGGLYKKLGFIHIHDSKPNYFYVVNKRRENRFKYRKSELVKQGFDGNKSEKQIMEERGIPRIYDCGCMCFSMDLSNKQ